MLPQLANLPPAGADVALERVRQLLVASEECRSIVTGGDSSVDPASRFQTVFWFNPLDNRDGPYCLVGVQPGGPDQDGPYGYSEQQLPVLIRLRFRWSEGWPAAHSGQPLPLSFSTAGGPPVPVNPVGVPRTFAAWDAAVLRALRADPKLSVTVDGQQLPLARTVVYGPHAFGVEPELAPDGQSQWYNADTVATYQLMTDFRTGSAWNLRGE